MLNSTFYVYKAISAEETITKKDDMIAFNFVFMPTSSLSRERLSTHRIMILHTQKARGRIYIIILGALHLMNAKHVGYQRTSERILASTSTRN